jgi:5-methylcytosine-specific restriction endonuclease McrA
MPLLSCLDCGIPTKHSRCDRCFAARELAKPEQAPRARASSAARGYDAKWHRVRLTILQRDNWTCIYCNKHLVGSDATVDHVNPLSKGGDRLETSNLVAACRSCNSQKSNK